MFTFVDLFLRLGAIKSVNTTLDNYKPWTAYNQTYIDMFKKHDGLHNAKWYRAEPYNEYWTDDILTEKVFKRDN